MWSKYTTKLRPPLQFAPFLLASRRARRFKLLRAPITLLDKLHLFPRRRRRLITLSQPPEAFCLSKLQAQPSAWFKRGPTTATQAKPSSFSMEGWYPISQKPMFAYCFRWQPLKILIPTYVDDWTCFDVEIRAQPTSQQTKVRSFDRECASQRWISDWVRMTSIHVRLLHKRPPPPLVSWYYYFYPIESSSRFRFQILRHQAHYCSLIFILFARSIESIVTRSPMLWTQRA